MEYGVFGREDKNKNKNKWMCCGYACHDAAVINQHHYKNNIKQKSRQIER